MEDYGVEHEGNHINTSLFLCNCEPDKHTPNRPRYSSRPWFCNGFVDRPSAESSHNTVDNIIGIPCSNHAALESGIEESDDPKSVSNGVKEEEDLDGWIAVGGLEWWGSQLNLDGWTG
ncbi:hypothetical protein Adt_33455 [Abeliophyllum distichum]|uniref:Uncharacterized protein n=1 Tax=Abeliophyllum distichum TaxID=126358 RepID=A0ABD1QZW3_9LAMI